MPESLDAFGRQRGSNPISLFESKQLFDNQPLVWDDLEESGADTTSVHSAATASVVMGVAAATAGVRTRQTFMRFNYAPGKSHYITMTGTLALTGGGDGITTRYGYFDDNNGVFIQRRNGINEIVLRSSVSGSPVDTIVPQSEWNGNKMDGRGNHHLQTFDPTSSQILVIDFQWLGVGQVRVGLNMNGMIIHMHHFLFSNLSEGVYMSTPNLPIRYQIENDGTGVASTMRHICSTVISEGGENPVGITRYESTRATPLTATTADLLYAVIGLRLKDTHLDCVVDLLNVALISESNDDFEWVVVYNPTVAGTFTYSDVTDSCLQSVIGASTNTVTGGTESTGGWAKTAIPATALFETTLRLGVDLSDVRDTAVLCVRATGNNAIVGASITWKELN